MRHLVAENIFQALAGYAFAIGDEERVIERGAAARVHRVEAHEHAIGRGTFIAEEITHPAMQLRRPAHDRTRIEAGIVGPDGGEIVDRPLLGLAPDGTDHIDRSEEHTSELQSLMRRSYAVFCLKK